MTDFVRDVPALEGRDRVQLRRAPNIDRKTIREYSDTALAEGLAPSPDEPFDEQLCEARIGRWFPELVDPAVRALTWPQIAAPSPVDHRSTAGSSSMWRSRRRCFAPTSAVVFEGASARLIPLRQ